ncbi:craniofacial development protein 1 [Anthonomus grandis grandis]|uniref:craniofacial development protein 1 n=1 Tax=Anthonomus grandis grandis TaxID=2921223 RepID=UPI002166655D|nr:craniofacial development protein 1 [Anthonomus grandis grandis]
MNNEDANESSDSSDEDYVPDSKVEDAVSEVESDGDPEDHLSGSDNETIKGKKRTKNKKTTKSKKRNIAKDDEETAPVVESPKVEEDQKKKADDLWADFMKDTGFKAKSSRPSESQTSKPKVENKPIVSSVSNKPTNKVKVTQVFEFAGEEVKVEKEVDSNSAEARLLSKDTKPIARKSGGLGGIGNVLSQLGKKQKISTLEKTKLDWDRFKKEENLEEELQTHNKGKDGYLERQDFLERADLRRFEIEKEIRNVERAKRFNSSL